MNCDVILEIGGKNNFKIDRESSSNELDSLQDIVEYINTLPKHEVKLILYDLQTSTPRLKNSLKYFLDKELIGNCSFENLKIRYPEETKLLEGLELSYNITLVDKAYSNGDMLKGRVIVNGVISYVFRNKFDVQNFAETEYKKHLAKSVIEENSILDEYLNEKYKDKLSRIKSANAEISTIADLITDYLNNSSEYTKLIKDGDKILDEGSILNDFCRELNKLQVINEDSESDLARNLRRLNWRRESFGKLELYKSLSTYIPEFRHEVSEQQFIDLSTENMELLLLKYFKDDFILKDYHVTNVELSVLVQMRLSKTLVKQLYKKVLINKNTERKATGQLALSKEYSDNITNLEDALLFFSNYLNVEIEGEMYSISIIENNGDLEFTYLGKKISDNRKVELKRVGRVLSLEFNFGYDTMNIFTPVDEDGVSNGSYQGYYIYRHINELGEETYIASTSVISPNLYNPPKFKTLKDTKLAVEGFNRSANVEKATKISIKQNINNVSGLRHAIINFITNAGQTITSLDYPINPKVKLLSLELDLLTNKKPSEILEFYKKLGIDISSLDTAEKIGTFLYAMVENGYSIHNLRNGVKFEGSIISDINNAADKQYLVERSSRNNDGTYTVYLKSLTDAGIVINSSGVDIDGNPPTKSLTSTLYNLKDTLENTIFKDTPISIVISDSDLLSELTDDNGNRVFPNGTSGVKAFIYNNTLYINLTNATINDLLHETFHIVLGAIKAQDMKNGTKNYENILNHYDKKVSSITKNRVGELYKNLANIDKVEEGVVRYLARQVENGGMFYNSDLTNEVLELFRKLFLNMQKNVRRTIELDMDSDIGFSSSISQLISQESNQMLSNRVASNLIEKGIEKGLILENC